MTLLVSPRDIIVPLENTDPAPLRSVSQLRVEARKAEGFGKPLAASLMRALARVLPGSGPVFERIEHWPGDLASDGVTFRLNAGLHALALAGRAEALERLYGVAGPPALLHPAHLDAELARVLAEEADALLGWLSHPTQTNEVARMAGLAAALLAVGEDADLPCEVLELGASAGLNLNFPHFAIRLGTRAACAPESNVTLCPQWRGRAAPQGSLKITTARGVDLHPLDVANPADRQSLAAYVWPGETARSARLEAAIGLALRHPPQVDTGLASEWLARQLATPQAEGVRRVVFHSMVLQYASPAERAAIDAALEQAGAQASPTRPLTRVSIEWRADRALVELRIAVWDGAAQRGEARLAATCHPYGEWIDWQALD